MSPVTGYEQGQVARFHNSYIKDDKSGCWLWKLNLAQGGYGRCYFNGKSIRAHRLSYELHNGTFDESLIIRHRCDNPSCVNPEHLIIGTQEDNMRDKRERQRSKGINMGQSNGKAKLTDEECSQIYDLIRCGLFSQKF